MWRLKACNRCRGDVFIEKDEFGWYEQCLQCGHRAELQSISESRKQPITSQKELVAVGSK